MATQQIQLKPNGKTGKPTAPYANHSTLLSEPLTAKPKPLLSPPIVWADGTDGERSTRGGATSTAAADLFICFNSRSSSSSSLMKLPSKSLFSPARPGVDAGHGPAAASSTSSPSMLYTSLSRRLRYSGSLRGGGQASPMFPPAGSGKKKAALEEPSSPKVTCIGQVRVKTRKQGKRMRAAAAARSRSRRRSEGGSFRERERQRYWAALPISICEAVRALGAEFNCFQPCGGAQSGCASSASLATEREKADRKRPARSYCGAVFARWLVALNEEGEKEVVSHVLPEEVVAKVEEGRLERLGDAAVVVEEEEEEAEYRVCVPPKNALLLMRCRSEPFRMASYTNRFWESPANPEMGRGEDEAEEEVEEEEISNATLCEVKAEIGEEVEGVEEKTGSEDVADVQVKEEDGKVATFVADESENTGRSSVCVEEEDGEGMKLNEQEIELGEEEQASDHESPPSKAPKDDDVATDEQIQEETPSKAETSSESDEREQQEAIEEEKTTQLPQTHTLEEEEEGDDGEEDAQPAQIESTEPIEEEDDGKVEEVKAIAIFETEDAIGGEEEADMAAKEVLPPAMAEEKVKEDEDGALPECLLLMLYEPKLSMEVSKETWVCSTDFFQWRPGKDRRPKLAGDTAVVGGGVIEGRRNSTDSRPSRPSGNRVAAVSAATAAAATAATGGRPPPPLSMATVVEEKLVKAAAYEPQVLTRCKSEPMRTSARLAPEACFWKSGRKMPQPPRRSLRADPVS